MSPVAALQRVALLGLFFAPTATRAEVIEIRMERVSYSPETVSARVGDTIQWVNNDIVAHTASARTGAWDVVVAPSQKNSVVVQSNGNLEYYCKFHPNMVGHITVLP
jgi:plastocyanin